MAFGWDDALAIGTTGAGLLGGIFGGSSSETSPSEAAYTNNAPVMNLSILDYLSGNNMSNKFQTYLDSLMGDYGSDRSRWNQYTSPILDQMFEEYDQMSPYRDAMLGQGARSYGIMADILEGAKPAFDAASNDVQDAFRYAQDVYRPAQAENINWMQTTGRDAVQNAFDSAQEYYGDTRDYLGKTQDYYNMSFDVVDPEQQATMAAADIANEYNKSVASMREQNAAYGLDPSSGASQAMETQMAADKALSTAGARTRGRTEGQQQQFENVGAGLNALQSGTSAVGSGASAVNNAASGMTNFGGVMGSTLSAGPVNQGTGIVQSAGNMGSNLVSGVSNMFNNPLTSNMASTVNNLLLNPTAPQSLVGYLGKFGEDRMGNIYDTWGDFNDTYNSIYKSNSSNQSGSGSGSLLGQGLSMLGKSFDKWGTSTSTKKS